jgi:hypothetical protein
VTGKTNIKTGLRAGFASAALVAAFVLPAQAIAADSDCVNAGTDPTAAQYCSVSGAQTGGGENSPTTQSEPQSESQGAETSSPAPVETSGNASVDTSGQGSLPFTGLDVGILLLVAMVLLGTGLALRRLTASGVNQG